MKKRILVDLGCIEFLLNDADNDTLLAAAKRQATMALDRAGAAVNVVKVGKPRVLTIDGESING